jgi:Phage terminase-like protein, large subunit
MRSPSKPTVRKLKAIFIEQFKSYQESVVFGSRLAGPYEKLMVERQLNDLERTDWQWIFDVDKAIKPLVWMAANLRFPDGAKKGEHLRLEPWQVWIIMVIFGWVHKDYGYRRYIDAYIEIPRKNGKSTMCGAIADYMAFSPAEDRGMPVYIAATSLDQAGECFSRAGACLQLGQHDGVNVYNSKNNKVVKVGTQQIIAISAEPKDGKLGHASIVDEYHQHKSNDLLDSLVTGNVSDFEPLTFRITTAGTELTGVCKMEHDKLVNMLRCNTRIDRYFAAIYCPDDADDYLLPSTWEKANPNYGVSVVPETLAANLDRSKTRAEQIAFKTKNLNLWCNSLEIWADMDKWNGLCCRNWDENEVAGLPCYGSQDLSSVSDFTATCLEFIVDGEYRQIYHGWIPEEKILDLELKLNVPLREWAFSGLITPTPGPVIDYAYVAAWWEEMYKKYDIQAIGLDMYRMSEFKSFMPSWFENVAIALSQKLVPMTAPTRQFERDYLTGKIQSGNNPVMTWQMSCAESYSDTNGNCKLIKPKVDRSAKRIDYVIAAIMAHDCATIYGGGPGLTPENLEQAVFFG